MKTKIKIFYMHDGPESHHHREQTEHKLSPIEQKKAVVDKIPTDSDKPKNSPTKKVHKFSSETKKIQTGGSKEINHPEVQQKIEEASKIHERTKNQLSNQGVPKVEEIVSDRESAEKLKSTLTRLEAMKLRKLEKATLPEGVEKELQLRTREEILKDVMKVKPEVMEKAMQKVLEENPELKGLPREKLEALAREKIITAKIRKLEEKVKDGKGHEIDKTQYDAIIERNPDIKVFADADPKLTKELIAVYGTKLTSAYAKLLKDVPKDEFPKNLEEFDQFMREKFAIKYAKEREGDALADGEDGSDGSLVDSHDVAEQVRRNAYNPKAVESLAGTSSLESKGNTFEKGNMTAEKAKLKEIIDKLPADSKVREMLQAGYDLIGINEKDKRIKDFLNNHGQKIDPAKTPWCRAFVNAELDIMGVATNGSLSARDGAKSIGKEVDSKDMLPGDIVVVERAGKASDGSPGGHIGIFLGFDSSGHPIILGGNQHNSVTIKTETRNVIGFRRAMPDEEAEKVKTAMNGSDNKGE